MVTTSQSACPPGAPALQVVGLRHRFGERLVLDGVDLDVGAGEIVGLVGSNGAGKTTTMRAIMGILEPLAGEITWMGHTVDRADRLRFGYMPEERGLYPQMRVLAQVAYFARLHGLDRPSAQRTAEAWLEKLDLGERAEERLTALSHGNQQRVQLAVALAHDPALLVLDEPFAGLDPTAVDVLSRVLDDQAARSCAILFSSHQLELVERLCSRVVILNQGRLLASGTLEELRRHSSRRLRIQVAGQPGWTPQLPGVRVAGRDSAGALLALEPGADAQAVLRAAQEAGPVEHFAYEAADLTELYRELVAP